VDALAAAAAQGAHDIIRTPARAKRATEYAMLFAIISLATCGDYSEGNREQLPRGGPLRMFLLVKRGEGEACDGGPRHLSFPLSFR